MSDKVQHRSAAERSICLELDARDIETLHHVVHYYERSMGLTRHVISLTARAEVKAKYRFILDEAKWLEKVVDATRRQLEASGKPAVLITLTPRAIVSLWGRLLSSVNDPRSRRKLKTEDVNVRQMLADRLGCVMRAQYEKAPALVLDEIATRRVREVEWMRTFMSTEQASSP